ncbi:hypothetical protein pb186bvf_002986 [Paramecium bursaria]
MMAPSVVMQKFQEFIESQTEARPDQSEILKDLRHFQRFFLANNYDVKLGIEYMRQFEKYIVQDIPLIVQERLNLFQRQMIRTGKGISGMYNAVMLGLIIKQGSFSLDQQGNILNQVISNCQDKGVNGIIAYLEKNQEVQTFQDILKFLAQYNQNHNLVDHLKLNGIFVETSPLGQSALLFDSLNRIIKPQIQQVINLQQVREHRIILVNAQQANFTIFVENENNPQYSVFIDPNPQQIVRQTLEEFDNNTQQIIQNNQLPTLTDFQLESNTSKMLKMQKDIK